MSKFDAYMLGLCTPFAIALFGLAYATELPASMNTNIQNSIDCSKVQCTVIGDTSALTSNAAVAHCPPGYQFVVTSNGPMCAEHLVPTDWR